jgi:Tol biopolymer transport system component
MERSLLRVKDAGVVSQRRVRGKARQKGLAPSAPKNYFEAMMMWRKLWRNGALIPALCLAVSAAAAGDRGPGDPAPRGAPRIPGWIVFDSKRNGQFDLWKMRPDGSGEVRLTDTPEWETCPDWSPDGTAIVFARKEPGSDDATGDIHLMDADGSNERLLVKNGTAPQFTPDGKGIVFERGRVDILRYDLRSGSVRRLVPPPGRPAFPFHMIKPRLSPDGLTAAFISDKWGMWNAWAMDLTGRQTHIGAGCQPTWTPDGKRIFFVTDTRYQENALWVYDWPEGPARRFLSLSGTYRIAYFPSVSDDGRWLLFAACPFNQHDHSSAHYQIFILDLAGGEPVRLSHNEYTERWPRLSTRAR